jgi:V8-like Glu-specific endopeptidase
VDAVVAHAQQAPQAVRRYWTARRIREAKPVPAPKLSRSALRGAVARASSSIEPTAGVEENIPSSSPVHLRSPLADFLVGETSAYPARVNGKLYFTNAEGEPYLCSASVVTSPGKSLILTAGHCAYSAEAGGWDHNFIFKPAYNNGAAPYGSWIVSQPEVSRGWIESEGENYAYDLAALTIYPNSAGTRIEEAVGAWGVTFNTSANQYHQVIGYPGEPKPYNGEVMIGCNTNFYEYEAAYTTETNGSYAVEPCDQGHGASGSPFVTESGFIQGVYSHFYCEIKPSYCGYIYGTYFGTAAQALYKATENLAPTLPVPPAAVPVPVPAPAPAPTPAPTPIVTNHKPRWCGRIYYKLHHRYHTRSARRRLQRTYRRYCR